MSRPWTTTGVVLALVLAALTPALIVLPGAAAAGSLSADRTLPDREVACGETFTVSIQIEWANSDIIAPEEIPPSGWQVAKESDGDHRVSHGGKQDSNGKVKWFLSDDSVTTVWYEIVVPDGTEGPHSFSGRLANRSETVTIGGDTSVTAKCDPQDSDADGWFDNEDNCPAVANADQADMDNDGTGDVCDPDRDGDGVDNASDNCAFTPNADQADADNDGTGDICDGDRDGDQVGNASDNCPNTPNPSQADMDGDSLGDPCDDDTDGDGVANSSDAFPNDPDETTDGDSDKVGDNSDNCPSTTNAGQVDSDGDGIGDVCDVDRDGDGVDNEVDNCPSTSNEGQADTDEDGTGNACDPTPTGTSAKLQVERALPETASCGGSFTVTLQLTWNGATSATVQEVPPSGWTPSSPSKGGSTTSEKVRWILSDPSITTLTYRVSVASDASGASPFHGTFRDNAMDSSESSVPIGGDTSVSASCTPSDGDGDGVTDDSDNCPSTSNANQADLDDDGTGDACDSDRDGDGVANSSDAFPDDPSASSDADGDGVADGSDNCPSVSNPDQADTDNDGTGDACQGAPTTDGDGDGVDDSADNCPATSNEGQADLDKDGTGDACDSDRDGDGTANDSDAFPDDSSETSDGDGDGYGDNTDNCPSVSNADQADTNNDGTGDACESGGSGGSGPNAEVLRDLPGPSSCGSAITVTVDLTWNGESGLIVREQPPAGWSPTDASHNGRISQGRVTWLLSNPSIGSVSYTVQVPSQADGGHGWTGTFRDSSMDSSDPSAPTGGDGSLEVTCGSSPPPPPTDTDGDGVTDESDNCPSTPNAGQADVDTDGLGDACDATDDRPSEPSEPTDSDGDDVADGSDNCPSTPNADQADLDKDGTGDACDLDRDGDGAANDSDAFPDDSSETSDGDGDGYGDNTDNCPSVSNADQADTNNDGTGDACQPQEDPSGSHLSSVERVLPTDQDPCGSGLLVRLDLTWNGAEGLVVRDLVPEGFTASDPSHGGRVSSGRVTWLLSSPSITTVTYQLAVPDDAPETTDLDGVFRDNTMSSSTPSPSIQGDQVLSCGTQTNDPAPADADADGVTDESDNCPSTPNADQADVDTDGLGDACDATDDRPSEPSEPTDSDGDGVADGSDNCPSLSNTGQADLDDDGTGDSCDSDRDGDGVANSSDAFPNDANETSDTDGDGIGDDTDNCPNVSNAGQADTNDDGTGDACQPQEQPGDGATVSVDRSFDEHTCGSPVTVTLTIQWNGAEGLMVRDRPPSGYRASSVSGPGSVSNDGRVTFLVSDTSIGSVSYQVEVPDEVSETLVFEGTLRDNTMSNTEPSAPVTGATALTVTCPNEAPDDQGSGSSGGGGGGGGATDDPDGTDSSEPDRDGDGHPDLQDNCPDTPNADQADSDQDGVGDVCEEPEAPSEPDSDGDGAPDSSDNCPDMPNADQADSDQDGVGDACDQPDPPSEPTNTAVVTRVLPTEAQCGTTVTVELPIQWNGVDFVLIEEGPLPEGLEATNPSNGGRISNNGKVKWMLSNDALTKVTYQVNVQGAVADSYDLSGVFRDNEMGTSDPSITLGGDETLEATCPGSDPAGQTDDTSTTDPSTGDGTGDDGDGGTTTGDQTSLTRDVPDQDVDCQNTFPVVLSLFWADATDLTITETVPEGAEVVEIGSGGTLTDDGRIQWVLTDPSVSVLMYKLAAADAAQLSWADATGATSSIGDQQLTVVCDQPDPGSGDQSSPDDDGLDEALENNNSPHHPFDDNADCAFNEDELFALIVAWKQGGMGADVTPSEADDLLFSGIRAFKQGAYC